MNSYDKNSFKFEYANILEKKNHFYFCACNKFPSEGHK